MGTYMAFKNIKLREQFEERAPPLLSNLFHGVTIHVNGLTTPSYQELKQLMALHGGRFENYETGCVTHIICSVLPDTKLKQLAHKRCVRPLTPRPCT